MRTREAATGPERPGHATDVAGGIIFAVVMVLVVPVAIMFGGAIWSALFGWFVGDDAKLRAEAEAPDAILGLNRPARNRPTAQAIAPTDGGAAPAAPGSRRFWPKR